MKTLFCITAGLCAAVSASAAPTLLNASTFAATLDPLSAVVETFDAMPAGFKSASLQLANSTFTSPNPFVGNFSLFPTQGVIDQQGRGTAFSNFRAGTTLFGVDLAGFVPSDLLEVTVVGLDSSSIFRATIESFGGFFGVQDSRGLVSVGFTDLGSGSLQGNYGFDNAVTGSAAIPEPASLALAALALVMMRAARRPRRQ